MDRLERTNDLLPFLRQMLTSWSAGIWTSMPGIVQSYNSAKMTVSVQPAIQAQIRGPTGDWVNTTMPLCVDCPVIFPGAGDFLMTFPLVKNDEGLLVFADRCIDSWWQSGGVQKQAELRMHDLSDGFFLPKCFSLPNVPANPSTNSAQFRSKDGLTYVEVAEGHIINVAAPGGCNFLGPVVFEAGVTFESTVHGSGAGGGTIDFGAANLKTTGDLKTGAVASINAHEHSGVVAGANNTGPPTG